MGETCFVKRCGNRKRVSGEGGRGAKVKNANGIANEALETAKRELHEAEVSYSKDSSFFQIVKL